MQPSVATITVAYNAAERLSGHIEALLQQSRPVQEVVVVDNGSDDGTSAVAARYPQVTLIRLPRNLGQGGGWSAGLAYAVLQKRHDWAWTFDQDSVPNDDALETLLEGFGSLGNSNAEVGIVAALPVHQETGECYPPLLWNDGFIKPSADQFGKPIWFADLVISSGCMVRSDLVQKAGLPRADFFIDFVDFEYCLRARSQGYKIAVVNRARIAHEIGKARNVRLLNYSALWPNHLPWREYYMARNLAFTVWWLYPTAAAKRFVVRHLLRHGLGLVLFGEDKYAGLKKIIQGFCDGLHGTLGARFRPS